MSALRTLVLGLALAGVAEVVGAGSDARAAEPFGGDPLVTWLPAAPVPVGATRELHVLALGADGAPIEGLSLTVKATGGSVEALEEVGGGLYVLAYTAPDAEGAYEVRLSGKTPDKQAVGVSVSVDVVADAEPLKGSADPAQLVLGQISTATLKLRGAGSDGILVRSSAGSVGKPVRVSSTYTAQLTPPKVNFPQVGLVTFADASAPVERNGWLAVPMSGSVAFPVKGPAGASVLLRVAGREFGPVPLGDDGKGKVNIEVPPGVSSAVKVVVEGGDTSESDLPLGIPATKRLGLFPVAEAIPSDPSVAVPVRVVVVTAEGEPDTAAKPTFSVSRGEAGQAKMVAPGVYEAQLTPPSEPGAITVSVALDGSEVDIDELELEVLQGLPDAVSLKVSGEGDTREATVGGSVDATLKVSGATAGAAKGMGTTRTFPLTDVGDGVEVLALAPSALSPNPARHVVVLPDRTAVAPRAAVGAWVVTVDAFGLPVPGQEVELQLAGLTGPTSVTTGDDGRARLELTGGGAGLARVSATSGAAEGEAVVVVGAGLAEISGLRGRGPIGARWAATHPVWSQGAAPAKPKMMSSREFVQIERMADASPGAVVPVTIRVLDASAAPVDGDAPGVEVSEGEVGEVVRDDAGVWTVPVTLPDEEGEVVLTVTTAAGTEERLVVMEGAFAQPAPTPPATSDDLDVPWLRGRVSGVVSSYRYQQTPAADPGGLLPSTLTFGGDGGAAASPAGIEADLRAWLDEVGVPYLGFHGKLRSSWYAVEADIFDAPASDSLLTLGFDVVGRYPFDTAGDRFWIGAKAGVAYDDFILFEGCLDPSCTLEYSSLGVASLTLGPELGAEMGPLFLVAGYGFGLANFSQPYRHAVDVNLGVHFIDNAFVDVGFSSVSRRVDLLGADSGVQRGELSDSQMLGTFGVGFAL